jgi:hypothetical protein
MGGDVLARQRLQASEPLRCCGRGGSDRGGFPADRPEADVWSGGEPYIDLEREAQAMLTRE